MRQYNARFLPRDPGANPGVVDTYRTPGAEWRCLMPKQSRGSPRIRARDGRSVMSLEAEAVRLRLERRAAGGGVLPRSRGSLGGRAESLRPWART